MYILNIFVGKEGGGRGELLINPLYNLHINYICRQERGECERGELRDCHRRKLMILKSIYIKKYVEKN